MNNWTGIGRLTKDVELGEAGENKFARFTIAINRKFKNADGEYDADFINCVAWNKTAELIKKHFSKGSEIGVSGRIQTGSYEKEGIKIYTTDIVVENITFIGSKKEGTTAPTSNLQAKADELFGSDNLEQKDALKNMPFDDSELPW
jgi:single-strand DNA-binding protein